MLSLVANTRVSYGKNYTPSGEEYFGVKVTIGGVLDPSEVKRSYDDIEAILHENKVSYKEHLDLTDKGTFKSYSIKT